MPAVRRPSQGLSLSYLCEDQMRKGRWADVELICLRNLSSLWVRGTVPNHLVPGSNGTGTVPGSGWVRALEVDLKMTVSGG